jgi:AcrR family transcriptional regulator
MARDQGTGDWAAWMATPAPGAPRPAAASGSPSAGQSDVTEPPSAAARDTEAPATAPETPPVVSPATEQVVSPVTDGLTGVAARPSTSPEVADADLECPSGHRSARREATRQRLLDAARAVFAERGVAGGSVEDICERAGFTRGAFYSNFSSKEDLFLAVYQEEVALRQRLLAEALTSAEELLPAGDVPALRAAIADIARWYVTAYSGDETWFVLMSEFRLQGLRQPELRPRLDAVVQHNTDELTAVVEGFLARAGLRLTVSPRHTAQAVLALYEDALARNLLAGRPFTADNEFLTEVIPRLLSGLLERPPSNGSSAVGG